MHRSTQKSIYIYKLMYAECGWTFIPPFTIAGYRGYAELEHAVSDATALCTITPQSGALC